MTHSKITLNQIKQRGGGAIEISQPTSTEAENKIPEKLPVSTSNVPSNEENPSTEGDHLVIPNTQVTMPALRRSARGRIPKIMHSMLSVTHPIHKPYEPTDYKDAVSCEDAALWREKMDEEIPSTTRPQVHQVYVCLQVQTWLRRSIPKKKSAINSQGIFTTTWHRLH